MKSAPSNPSRGRPHECASLLKSSARYSEGRTTDPDFAVNRAGQWPVMVAWMPWTFMRSPVLSFSAFAVPLLMTLRSAPVSKRKFNGRVDWGTWTCIHNNPSLYSKGMALTGDDDTACAPTNAAKQNKNAPQYNRMNMA